MGKMKRPDMNRIMRTPTGNMMSTMEALKKKKELEYEVINIPVSKLVPMAYNKEVYDIEQLDFIGATIQQYGVLQPLIVQEHSDDDKYSIIAGERRYQSYMATQDPEHPTGTLPCRVFPADMDPITVKILLILTNATSRARTAETQMLELKNLVTLFDEAATNGIDIGFSLKELATNQLQISERQYQKYQSSFHVIDALQEPLKKYDVNLAAAIGAKPEDVQEEIYTRWQADPEQSIKNVYEEVNNEYKDFKNTTKTYEAQIASLRQELKEAKQAKESTGDASAVSEINEQLRTATEEKKEHQASLKEKLTNNRNKREKKSDDSNKKPNAEVRDVVVAKTVASDTTVIPDPFLLSRDKALSLAEVSIRALSIRSKEGNTETVEKLEDLKRQIDYVIGRIKESGEEVAF